VDWDQNECVAELERCAVFTPIFGHTTSSSLRSPGSYYYCLAGPEVNDGGTSDPNSNPPSGRGRSSVHYLAEGRNGVTISAMRRGGGWERRGSLIRGTARGGRQEASEALPFCLLPCCCARSLPYSRLGVPGGGPPVPEVPERCNRLLVDFVPVAIVEHPELPTSRKYRFFSPACRSCF
jgi:hypothetical protein